ncbi:transcription-repair coupling factor, partial [bacterium]|nr:transcription-repair coupling factor [bacterium]
GIRQMSLIETAPEERLPIKTYLFDHNPSVIKAAITRELNRQGQVYFLHNKVETIDQAAYDLQKILPQARIAIGHGQMSQRTLEEIMLDFYNGQYDILVCSTIIENGLDIPNVNTIIVNNAHCLGLAQLYQLRGRVGRSSKQGYCYLLCPPHRELNPEAQKRLKILREFTELGAGFKIARRDLELRGAGNILGAKQSGHIASVGFGLYCRMLEDAIRYAKNLTQEKNILEESSQDRCQVIFELPIPAHIPADYIEDDRQKVAIYQRLSKIETAIELKELTEELRDRYGKLPAQAQYLLKTTQLKLKCTKLLIPSIRVYKDVLFIAIPFIRELSGKELYNLSHSTDWTAQQLDGCLKFTGLLWGGKVGNPEMPSPDELLEKLEKIILFLEKLPAKPKNK